MNGFQFHSPWILLALIPLAGLCVWTWWKPRQRTVLLSSATLVADLPRTWPLRLRSWLPWLRFAGLALLVVACARPQWGTEQRRLSTEGIAIQLCLDRSGSMLALDFEIGGETVNRMDVVKATSKEFVEGRTSDHVGIIAFGGFAEALCPMTLDQETLIESIGRIEIASPVYDSRGRVMNRALFEEEMQTAIGDALALAVDRLRGVEARSKVVVLVSDGENNAGVLSPDEAVELAKKFGIKVYTIGVGSTGRVRCMTPEGRLAYADVALDEKGLEKIAVETGGQYFNARSTDALENIFHQIDELEKSTTDGRSYVIHDELFGYVLTLGLMLCVAESLLATTRFRGLV